PTPDRLRNQARRRTNCWTILVQPCLWRRHSTRLPHQIATLMSYQFSKSEAGLGWLGAGNTLGRGSPFGLAPGDAETASPPLDTRSETNIATLKSWVQPVARQFIQALRSRGIDARVISGTRSYDEQNALYAQGRTTPGRIVT